jgi:hypothetical protein
MKIWKLPKHNFIKRYFKKTKAEEKKQEELEKNKQTTETKK